MKKLNSGGDKNFKNKLKIIYLLNIKRVFRCQMLQLLKFIGNINKSVLFRRIYIEKIKNNKAYGLYDKLIYHPDLTKIDYDYLTKQKNQTYFNVLYI